MQRPCSPLLGVSFIAVALLASRDSSAQTWSDGGFARTQHTCWQGIYPAIPEDLAWTYVGVAGLPSVGDTYYMRITVAGFGCSGAWAFPEVKLPPNTTFAVDGSHPIRCYLGPYENAQQLTDGSCPLEPSDLTTIGGGFVSFPPRTQEYWPLPPGKLLRIEFPVRSSAPLYGLGSSNDFLLGAVQFLDNSPGNPIPSYSAPPAGYTSGIPSGSAWQGVYVAQSVSSVPTNTLVTFAEPSATGLHYVAGDASGGSVHVTLQAHIYNPNCYCDAGQVSGGNCLNRSLAFTLNRVGVVDDPLTLPVDGGICSSGGNEATCSLEFRGLQWGETYEYKYAPLTGAVYFQGAGCAASGIAPQDTPWRNVTPIDPDAPVKFTLIANASEGGTVALLPEGGAYDPETEVSVTATAVGDSVFAHWVLDGDDVSAPNPWSVTMDADHSLVAVFTTAGSVDGDGDTTPGDGDSGPNGGDSGQTANEDDGGGDSGGCNAAGTAIAELSILATVVLVMRRRRA